VQTGREHYHQIIRFLITTAIRSARGMSYATALTGVQGSRINNGCCLTPKKLVAFRLDLELIAGLEEVKRKTGAPIAEQVHRAIQAWLAAQGVNARAPRPRARTRGRS
jgi:hypothetical protein